MKTNSKIFFVTVFMLLASYAAKQAAELIYAKNMVYYELEEKEAEKEGKEKEKVKEITDDEIAASLFNMSSQLLSLNYVHYTFSYHPHNPVNDPSPPPDFCA